MTTISGNNVSYTASNLVDSIGGLIQRIITANSADTLPTATNIITAFTGSNNAGNVGQSFTFTIYNNSSFILTLTTNTGVSLIDGTTTDNIYPQNTRLYTVIQTAVSAVMIYILGNGTVAPETNSDLYLANGKILVGNTANIATSTTLAAGAGINITNGGGTVTIAATGSSNYSRTVVNTATYTVLSSDDIIAVTYTTTGSVTLTLPLIATVGLKSYVIKDEGQNAEINNILINTTGVNTIEGQSNAIINLSSSSWTLYNNGTSGWFLE